MRRVESGITSVEVAIAMGVLVAIFAVSATYLFDAGTLRRNSSTSTVHTTLPCQGALSAIPGGCD